MSCSDQIQNDHETCVDGGGSVCSRRCNDGETCAKDSDCGSGLCFQVNSSTSICVSCDNGKLDGNETCIDGGEVLVLAAVILTKDAKPEMTASRGTVMQRQGCAVDPYPLNSATTQYLMKIEERRA